MIGENEWESLVRLVKLGEAVIKWEALNPWLINERDGASWTQARWFQEAVKQFQWESKQTVKYYKVLWPRYCCSKC